MDTGRFVYPSSDLSLASLLRRGHKALLIGLGLAILGHWSLTQITGLHKEDRAVKPLTTHFVKRQPRLTKPLELKKRPRPKRRPLRRKMVSVKAKVSRQEVASSIQSVQVLDNVARPRVQMSRSVGFSTGHLEPETVAEAIEGAKESQHVLDMSLEMMDVDALDTGRYQAMVIQDPNDKRNIKGFLRLAIACPFSVTDRDYHNGIARRANALNRLVARLNEWTGIQASVAGRITFDSAEFFETPWVFLGVNFSLQPTQSEVENLGKYMLTGGFFFFHGGNWHEFQGERHLIRFVTDALESQGYRRGVDWEFEFLGNDHAIFHCYYDFPDGTPAGGAVVGKYLWGTGRDDGVEPWSKGVEIDGRLVAFHTNQGYGWGDWGHVTPGAGDAYAKYDPAIQFQFGINTIIFALTQEGSITKRVMDSVK